MYSKQTLILVVAIAIPVSLLIGLAGGAIIMKNSSAIGEVEQLKANLKNALSHSEELDGKLSVSDYRNDLLSAKIERDAVKAAQAERAIKDYEVLKNQLSETDIARRSLEIQLEEIKRLNPTLITCEPGPAKGTEEMLRLEIKKSLRSSNRGIEKLYKFEDITDVHVKVAFTINDNLTKGMIKTGAEADTFNVIKAVHDSGFSYSDITVHGTFPIVDKFGNTKEATILEATFSSSTVKKINWEDMLIDNVFVIADKCWLHPSFK